MSAAEAATFVRARVSAEEPALIARGAGQVSALLPRAPEGPSAPKLPAPVLSAAVLATPGLAEVTALAVRVAGYDPRADIAMLERAGRLAAEAHATQTRENGDPYITHPLAVAEILVGYRLDSATIATALLHDVVEDTRIGLPEIERRFGAEVTRLVDGVTKLTRIELQSERTKQAENLRKLVLAMSEDIRVLIVKLADRLHNMRTLHFVPQAERRQKTARETLDIFTPLAERIGMDALKTELETLAFQEMHPEARQTIAARLTFLRGQGANLIKEIEADLKRVLTAHEVPVLAVEGREKSPFSIWLKMQKKNVTFEAMSDVMAFRVIVDGRAQCYTALGAVHDAYRVVPGRFKDFISTPKSNGYQSLHTGVTVPDRRNAKIEVQIRTREMHEVAEYGVAAHWIYKQGEAASGVGRERKRYPWVRALLDILENAEGPQDFLDHTRLELHRDLVFCFSPKGDLIELPRGATPIDFAYEVHSEVGDTCVGAKVNGKIVPLRAQLENGDQVEIITARGGTPNPAWERFVVTGKARARIRRFVHARQREEHQQSGRAALAKAFRQEGLDFTEKLLEGALKALKQPGLDEVYLAVGAGALSARDVLHAAVPELRIPPRTTDPPSLARPRGRLGAGPLLGRAERPSIRAPLPGGLPITGLVTGMPYHFAGCCHPLPGERIIGIVTTGKGVTVHGADCQTLEQFSQTPERFLDIDWDDTASGSRAGRITVETVNRPSALACLTDTVAHQDGVVTGLRVLSRDADTCEVALDVEVSDLRHLERVMGALRAPAENLRVERARG